MSKQMKTDPRFMQAFLGAIALFVSTGGRMRLKNGHASVFMPMWIYDLVVKMNFTVNWITGAATFFLNGVPFQKVPDWNTDTSLSPKAVASSPEALDPKALESMKLSIMDESMSDRAWIPYGEVFQAGWTKERNLIQLFDSLPPAKPEMLRGKAFRGRILMCGRFLDIINLGIIQPIRLAGIKWGKRYRTQYVGDPLCFTFLERLHIPSPTWGNVGMHTLDYRGRPHATMAYDHQPWLDMFAVLDDGSTSGRMKFLGLWCHRQKCGGWFTLTELKDVDVTLPGDSAEEAAAEAAVRKANEEAAAQAKAAAETAAKKAAAAEAA